MKNTSSSATNNLHPARFATLVSALLFAFGLTLAFWIVTAPVAQAANPKPTPTSPTPTPGRGHQQCTVCHKPAGPHPQTLTIDCNGLQDHLAHGDHEGPCQVTQVTNP